MPVQTITNMPTLTIDNQTITVPEGKTVLEAAEELGIVVPHFCYHKELGAVGACRMCAVTVHEGSFKGLKMSCLIKVEDGMVVTTNDERSETFRKRVGEWQMMNHPHDCPVCDEGGECQLQEMTIAAGHGQRRYDGPKRTYNNQDLGPFIAQEMNRCIQCYRCVRTYQDFCGGRDFGVLGSRNRVFFGRFKDGMLESDFSGNIVDACPTGVFTDKTYRFKSRFWDLQEAPSVCPHCSLGCATVPGGRYREMQRVRGGENPEVNGAFICDRGRFGSSYANHPQRPRRARIDEQQVSVPDALSRLNQQARDTVRQHGREAVLLVGSERASLEANWLLQQWARELGCQPPVLNPHGPGQAAAAVAAFDLSDRLASLRQIRESDLVVVVGADPLAEAPMLAVALRQTVRNGGQVMVYDPRPVELPFCFDHQRLSPTELYNFILDGGDEGMHVRDLLKKAERPVLVGGGLMGATGLQQLHKLALLVSNDDRPCLVHPLLGGPNSFGTALLADGETEDLIARLESGAVKMLVCLENDPLVEAPARERFAAALTRLDNLVVCDYLDTELAGQANLFIPTRTPLETAGTFINNEGRMVCYEPVMEPGIALKDCLEDGHPSRRFSSTTPGGEPWAAVAVLQNLLGRDAGGLADVRRDLAGQVARLAALPDLVAGTAGFRVSAVPALDRAAVKVPEQPAGSLQLIVTPARYGSDLLSRASDKLEPRFPDTARALMHGSDAARLGLVDGDRIMIDSDLVSMALPVRCCEDMAGNCVILENSPALPSPVPRSGIAFCLISKEVADD